MFDYKKGPFFCTLEESLNQLNVKRQAYQGGTFVGNHVHKLLKVNKTLMLQKQKNKNKKKLLVVYCSSLTASTFYSATSRPLLPAVAEILGGQGGRSPPHFFIRGGTAPPLLHYKEQMPYFILEE